MKKRVLGAYLLGSILCLAGCGNGAADSAQIQGDTDTKIESSQEMTGETSEETTEEREQETTQQKEADQNIEITSVHYEEKVQNVSYQYDVPIVSIPQNVQVQETIQEDLQEYVENFLLSLESYMEEENAEIEVSQSLIFEVIRADETVISLAFANEGYAGGAHGWRMMSYFNYDTETGERITFDTLGENFRAGAEAIVEKKAKEMREEQGDIFFPDFEKSICLVVLDGTESYRDVYGKIYSNMDLVGEDRLMDATFYITDTGFGFVSGQYVLQPYAAGIIEFEVDASELADCCDGKWFDGTGDGGKIGD